MRFLISVVAIIFPMNEANKQQNTLVYKTTIENTNENK